MNRLSKIFLIIIIILIIALVTILSFFAVSINGKRIVDSSMLSEELQKTNIKILELENNIEELENKINSITNEK